MTPSGSPADPLAAQPLTEDEQNRGPHGDRDHRALFPECRECRWLATLDATRPSGDEALGRLRAMTWDNPDVAEGVRFAVEYLSARPSAARRSARGVLAGANLTVKEHAASSSAPDVERLPPNAERILLDYWWEHGTEALEETNASGLAAVVIRDLRAALSRS